MIDKMEYTAVKISSSTMKILDKIKKEMNLASYNQVIMVLAHRRDAINEFVKAIFQEDRRNENR